jgi:hypothetical protein
MARDLPFPIFLDLPPLPNLSELKELGPREIDDRMLAACPSGWREIFKGMLDNANLHSHNLNLPGLLKELAQIRNHEMQMLNLQQAENQIREAISLIGLYAMLESGPECPQLRGYVKESMREAVDLAIEKLAVAGPVRFASKDNKDLATEIAEQFAHNREHNVQHQDSLMSLVKMFKEFQKVIDLLIQYDGPFVREMATYVTMQIADEKMVPRPWWMRSFWKVPYWMWIVGSLLIANLFK